MFKAEVVARQVGALDGKKTLMYLFLLLWETDPSSVPFFSKLGRRRCRVLCHRQSRNKFRLWSWREGEVLAMTRGFPWFKLSR